MITLSTRPAAGLLAVAALLALSPTWAESPRASADATYRLDRAACLDVSSQHERSSCLREAAAVRDEARRGKVSGGETPETRAQNALQRCAKLPLDNRAICERMVRGEGNTSGSVAGGGVLRELETEVDAAAPPLPASLPPAPAPAPAR